MCARSDNITRMVSEEMFDHHEAVVGDTRLHYVRRETEARLCSCTAGHRRGTSGVT
jgi:ethanolamine ammonia-lyase small subunit